MTSPSRVTALAQWALFPLHTASGAFICRISELFSLALLNILRSILRHQRQLAVLTANFARLPQSLLAGQFP